MRPGITMPSCLICRARTRLRCGPTGRGATTRAPCTRCPIALPRTGPRASLGPLVLVVGAAVDGRRAGIGFVATSGHYGVEGGPWPEAIGGAERGMTAVLRAVECGLDCLYGTGTAYETPVSVRVDDLSAVVLLRDWARGCTGLPEECEPALAAAGLEALRRTVTRNAAALTFRHQPPRTGTSLNEAANALAGLGLHGSRGTSATDVMASTARRYAGKNLAAYCRSLAALER